MPQLQILREPACTRQLTMVVVFLGLAILGMSNPLRVSGQENEPTDIAVPLTINRHHNIVVEAQLNGTDPLKLMLHTAAGELTLTEQATKRCKSLTFHGSQRVNAWGGQAESRFSLNNQLSLGKLSLSDITLWEDVHSGKDSDGKFGLTIFHHKIIQLDFDQGQLRLLTVLPEDLSSYSRLDIEVIDGQIFAPATCRIGDQRFDNKFLIHTGYAGGVLLDDEFAARTHVDSQVAIKSQTSLKDSFGNTVQVKEAVLAGLIWGQQLLSDVPLGFFSGKIGSQRISLLGCQVLTRFNVVLDLANQHLYLRLRK